MQDKGQDSHEWKNWWSTSSIESEIRKWDFYGLRPWIVKYVTRHGKSIEAGCGLGRWTAYLSELGIDIDGIDFSEEVIQELIKWNKETKRNIKYEVGDVKKLNYEDNSLSCYISLGVIEHFIEGPAIPLKEAYRVLRPGGIAIVTTPSISWFVLFAKIRTKIKRIIKRIIGRKVVIPPFFQYEYRPRKLARFVKKAGLKPSEITGGDVLFTFTQLGNYSTKYIQPGKLGYRIEKKFGKGFLRNFGAQSICIAIKEASQMHCFHCGELTAKPSSLKKYSVPTCESCAAKEQSKYYLKSVVTGYHNDYIIEPAILTPQKQRCEYCGVEFTSDELFENYAFSKKVCGNCLKIAKVNIELANEHLQPIWRKKDKNAYL